MQVKYYQTVAKKDYPHYGVKKGQLHYFWVLRSGELRLRSLGVPSRSELESLEPLSEFYAMVEYIEDKGELSEEDRIGAILVLQECAEELPAIIDSFEKSSKEYRANLYMFVDELKNYLDAITNIDKTDTELIIRTLKEINL